MSEPLSEMLGAIRDLQRRMGEAESKEWVGPTRGCRVYRNTNQSIPNTTLTPLSFSTEIFDLGGCWSVAQPTRLIAPRDGYYMAFANVLWFNNGDTDGYRWVGIYTSAGDQLGGQTRQGAGAANINMAMQANSNGPFWMARADWVTVQVYQSSGGAMNVLAASTQEQTKCCASLLRMH